MNIADAIADTEAVESESKCLAMKHLESLTDDPDHATLAAMLADPNERADKVALIFTKTGRRLSTSTIRAHRRWLAGKTSVCACSGVGS